MILGTRALLSLLLVSSSHAFTGSPVRLSSSTLRPTFVSDTQRVHLATPRESTSLNLFFNSKEPVVITEPEVEDTAATFAVNVPFLAAWIGLVGWAFTAAPGEVGSAADTEILNNIIANPTDPGINELYYTAFNFFATIPVILAALVLPQGSKKSLLPAGPFLALSTFFGYFALGPYMSFRPAPVQDIQDKSGEISWFTKNVVENRFFNIFILAFTLYLPVAANVFEAYQNDPQQLWQGFVDIISTSRFAAVSLVDIAILYVTSVALIVDDYKLRKPTSDDGEAQRVALLAALLPVVGSSIYCAVRPPLPIDSEE